MWHQFEFSTDLGAVLSNIVDRAGWRKSATGFSWADTIQHVGKIVIVATAAGALDAFDLNEVTVTGGAGR